MVACSGEQTKEAPATPAPAVEEPSGDETLAVAMDKATLERMRAQFAVVDMDVDASFLSTEEVAVVNKLNEVGNYMSAIYALQRSEKNPGWRAEIAASDLANKELLLDLFDLHFGPWDTLDNNKPFLVRRQCLRAQLSIRPT